MEIIDDMTNSNWNKNKLCLEQSLFYIAILINIPFSRKMVGKVRYKSFWFNLKRLQLWDKPYNWSVKKKFHRVYCSICSYLHAEMLKHFVCVLFMMPSILTLKASYRILWGCPNLRQTCSKEWLKYFLLGLETSWFFNPYWRWFQSFRKKSISKTEAINIQNVQINSEYLDSLIIY